MMLEAYVEILAIAATVFGIIMSLSYFPQTYKIIKRKSSSDISLLSFLILLIGLLVWLMYGLSINNMPLIIANAIGIIANISVITVYFKYRVKE
ncbi:MAG: hypothetical protein JSV92_02130 [archaeon]|nr:MAG: hypothetical protein JSV92_02130 [archaeon]